MLKRWQTIDSRVIHHNPWWSYRRDRFQIPGGHRGEYHYVHTGGSSLVAALSEGGRLVMVRQYRYLCRRDSIEFPCGSVKPGSSPLETAHLELAEEAGFGAASMEPAGEFNPYNGVTDEICRVYLARGLSPAAARPDPTEEFEVLHIPPLELQQRIGRGEIWDGMTLAAWSLIRAALPAA